MWLSRGSSSSIVTSCHASHLIYFDQRETKFRGHDVRVSKSFSMQARNERRRWASRKSVLAAKTLDN